MPFMSNSDLLRIEMLGKFPFLFEYFLTLFAPLELDNSEKACFAHCYFSVLLVMELESLSFERPRK